MKVMKKIVYILLAATSAVAFSACSLDTEVQSEFDESAVFSNYTLAEYNVFGISHSFGEINN